MSPSKQEQDIIVEIATNFDCPDLPTPKVRELVKAVCNRFELSKATVSIAIVNDLEMRRLNTEFLGRKCTTDCLSFDLSGGETTGAKLFEVVVNGEMAVKEARLQGHSGEAELALYVTHGLLHNLGFDDSTHAKAKKMHDAEDEILQQFGYGLIYNKGKRA